MNAPDYTAQPPRPRLPRGAVAWALYDFANTIFSMSVITMYLAQWVVVDRKVETFWYSLAYSGSMALVALTLPVLGALSDARPGGRLRFLLVFTVMAVGGTALIGSAAMNLPGTAGVAAALVAFFLANYAFQGSLVFYNALLPLVSTPSTLGRVSGFGVAMGYLGSMAGLLLVAPFVDGKVPIFNWHVMEPSAMGRAAAFYPTAFFFGIFSIPLFVRIRTDRRADASTVGPGRYTETHSAAAVAPLSVRLRAAVAEVIEGIRDTRRYPGVRRFLIANYLFVDAINTVILFMAVYAYEVMGMPDSTKIPFFMVATTGAVVGSLLLGPIADKHGPKRTLEWILVGWGVALGSVVISASPIVFWAAGVLIGICLGGVWTTSRALLARLTPESAHGRFFGLYALSDKAAAVVGPLLWGLIIWAGKPLGPARYRLAVLSLTLFMLAGLWVLRGVREVRMGGPEGVAEGG